MKELLVIALKALKEAWYPEVPEGEKRKVKVNPGGVALLGVLLVAGQVYLMRAELAEVKRTTSSIWGALVQAGIAHATPAPQTAEATPTVTPPPALASFRLLSDAEAAGRGVGPDIQRGVPALDPGAVDRVGKLTEAK
jgi:hypothetical protein